MTATTIPTEFAVENHIPDFSAMLPVVIAGGNVRHPRLLGATHLWGEI